MIARRLESLAVECGVAKNVQFAGLVPPEKLPDYFRLADVFVMPSTGEGFGIVFLEAMATGVCVIGGNQDGSADPLADGELGWAVDPDNEQELISAICAALSTESSKGRSRQQVQSASLCRTSSSSCLVEFYCSSLNALLVIRGFQASGRAAAQVVVGKRPGVRSPTPRILTLTKW